jgi:hypothetical protein
VTLPRGLALARIAVYVGLGLVGLHLLRGSWSSVSPALETWLASGKQEIQATRTLLARDQVHQQQAARARQQAAILSQRTDTAQAHFQALADSFRAHLLADSHATPQQTADFLRVSQSCFDALHLCRARGDSLQRADSLDAARADSLKAALVRSDSSLAVGLTVAQCHFLLVLPCVSRMTALEVGVAGGLLGGFILFRH